MGKLELFLLSVSSSTTTTLDPDLGAYASLAAAFMAMVFWRKLRRG